MTRRALGIFVGGTSSRMGTPKGLLMHQGETLLERAVRIARECDLRPLIVGNASAYAHLCEGVERVADSPPGVGPIGGLCALLENGATTCVALACDMPGVTSTEIDRLLAAPAAEIVACSRGDRFEPLLARYAPQILPRLQLYVEDGGRSFQRFLRSENVQSISFDDEVLRDWDCPSDIPTKGQQS